MISNISIQSFNYDLPDSAVAKYPLPERDSSKLLVWKNNTIEDHHFSELPQLLPKTSLLVFNNTRVIRARLNFTKSTGAKIEIFCLEPIQPHDYQLSFAQTSSCTWKCIVGNKKRWKGELLEMEVMLGGNDGDEGDEKVKGRGGDGETGGRGDWETEGLGDWETEGLGRLGRKGEDEANKYRLVLTAEFLGEIEEGFEIRFRWDNHNFTFAGILEAAGNIPIPPYLHRDSEEIDLTVYQTVYSKIKGSVAAPTAGLHFTENVFRELKERNITSAELTLHVGAGTFQPVKSALVNEHQMHNEYFSVQKTTIEQLLSFQDSVIAVGTTSVRTLESLYWIGLSILKNPKIKPEEIFVDQWEPYRESTINWDTSDSLNAILEWMYLWKLSVLDTSTRIMILPGYKFRIINGLVTNFHQPQSTLLLLISAILGEDWKRVYAHALENGYRFLSYGDSNLYLF